MKKNQTNPLSKLFIIIFSFITFSTYAQVAGKYNFSASSGTYTALAGASTIAGVADDDAISSAINIGFNFNFGGTAYSQVLVSSNGFLSFSGSAGSEYENNLSSGASRPLVAPLWDDLSGSGGTASYLLSGTTPNRIFSVQWSNWKWNYNAAAAVISFQVKLYESDNRIEFIYSQLAGSINSGSASIGLAGANAGDYISLNSAGSSPTASSSTNTTTINAKPATGQLYSFSPINCFTPTNVAVSNITTSTASLSWSGFSTTGYEWKVVASGAGVNATAVSSGTTSGSTSTANITNLTTGNAYDVYVRAICAGGTFSDWTDAVTFATPITNDNCNSAITVAIYANNATGQANATTVIAGSIDEGIASPSCNSGATTKYDVWYKFVTPASLPNNIVLTTAAGTENDWVMTLYGGSCAELSELRCSDDVNDFMPEIQTCVLQANTTYYIRLYPTAANTSATCTFWVYQGVACSSAPANDACASAVALTTTPQAGTTVGATPVSMAQPTCQQFATINDVWYTFSSGSGNSRTLNVDLVFSNIQSGKTIEYAVYKGSCGSLVELWGAYCGSMTSNTTINLYGLEDNQTYFVRVWSTNSTNAGTFQIALANATPLSNALLGNAVTASSCQNLADIVINASNNSRWTPLMDGSRIVAEINANGNNLGLVTSAYFINSGSIRTNGANKYLDRNIGISAENASPSSAVSIRFYYSTAEQTAYQTATGGLPTNITHESGLSCDVAPTGSGGIITATRSAAPFAGAQQMEFNTPNFSGFFIGPGVVLPIELAEFTVTKKLKINELTWKTASEQNTQQFVIERTTDPNAKWETLGTVKAVGNSAQMQTYQWNDENPSCIAYYRLRAVDFDTKEQVSKIVSMIQNCANSLISKVYPNPTNDNLTLELSSNENTMIQISLHDALGRQLLTQKQALTEGGQMLTFDLRTLPQGIYWLTLFDGVNTKKEKIIKLKY